MGEEELQTQRAMVEKLAASLESSPPTGDAEVPSSVKHGHFVSEDELQNQLQMAKKLVACLEKYLKGCHEHASPET